MTPAASFATRDFDDASETDSLFAPDEANDEGWWSLFVSHGAYGYLQLPRVEDGVWEWYICTDANAVFRAFPPNYHAEFVVVVVAAAKLDETIGFCCVELGGVVCFGCGLPRVGHHFHLAEYEEPDPELILFVFSDEEMVEGVRGWPQPRVHPDAGVVVVGAVEAVR